MNNENDSTLPRTSEPSPALATLSSQIKGIVEIQLAKVFTRLVQTLRIYTLVIFIAGIFSSAIFISLVLLVLGYGLQQGQTPAQLGTSALWLGGSMIVLAAIVACLAFGEKFWIHLFRIDKIADDIQKTAIQEIGN